MSDEKKIVDLSNRVGQFSLIINKGDVFKNEKQLEELKHIMSSLIVISAVVIRASDQIHYIALSEHFEETEIGKNIPCYFPVFTKKIDSDEIINIEWRKYNEICN